MKKIFVVLLLSLGIMGSAFAQSSCDCSGNEHRRVDAMDDFFQVNRTCNEDNYDNLVIYGAKIDTKACRRDRVGGGGCGNLCNIYQYVWEMRRGSCVRGKTLEDPALDFMPSSVGKICWQPICKNKEFFFKGALKQASKGIHHEDAVNYSLCQPCRLTMVEMNTTDPTEISYIKLLPVVGSDTACPANSKSDEACASYRMGKGKDGFAKEGYEGCVKRGCRCTSGKPTERTGDDDDTYVECK